MKQNVRNSDNMVSRVFGQLAAERKKTAVAFGLIAVMAFMWIRVLTRNSPASAGAAVGQQTANPQQTGSDMKLQISFTELPKTPGRNDVLTRDFFDSDRWRHFRDARGRSFGAGQVSVVSKDGSDQIVRRAAAKLKLLAIWTEDNPQAYINDRLLSVGDKLTIREGVNKYEFEVTAIEENEVHLTCGDAQIRLKLVNVIEATD
jgi:hypothetical protein